jgi:hypothetical protein
MLWMSSWLVVSVVRGEVYNNQPTTLPSWARYAAPDPGNMSSGGQSLPVDFSKKAAYN